MTQWADNVNEVNTKADIMPMADPGADLEKNDGSGIRSTQPRSEAEQVYGLRMVSFVVPRGGVKRDS